MMDIIGLKEQILLLEHLVNITIASAENSIVLSEIGNQAKGTHYQVNPKTERWSNKRWKRFREKENDDKSRVRAQAIRIDLEGNKRTWSLKDE